MKNVPFFLDWEMPLRPRDLVWTVAWLVALEWLVLPVLLGR
jgi:hypothetical protein